MPDNQRFGFLVCVVTLKVRKKNVHTTKEPLFFGLRTQI
jgi:hypothetical protein